MAKKFVGTLEKDAAGLDLNVRSHTIQMLSKGHSKTRMLKKELGLHFLTMLHNLKMT